jgi:hypothetical protein
MSRVLSLIFGVLLLGMLAAEAQPDEVAYELQERCGKRAAEVHARHFPDAADPSQAYDYQNHYNTRLNKCFIVESNTLHWNEDHSQTEIKTILLSDVNENKVYGKFDPITCEVTGKTCHSQQEWRELIKPYTEE